MNTRICHAGIHMPGSVLGVVYHRYAGRSRW
jgi:hypothetical protein